MKDVSTAQKIQFKVLLTILLLATLTRIALPPMITHIPNFSPIDAIALFCGFYFRNRLIALFVLLFSVWIGDIILNKIFMGHWQLFYSGFYWQYACYCLIAVIGITLRNKLNASSLLTSCLASSILFFVISNFGVWCSATLYPLNVDGLITCFVAAIPFFKNTVLSDLFFSFVLFGCVRVIESYSRQKRINSAHARSW